MLKVFSGLKDIRFGELMAVYTQSIKHQGRDRYPDYSHERQMLEAEQDYYAFLQEYFKQDGAVLAVWAPQGHYEAALRCEPYRDGFLIEGLETAPDSRRRGYAQNLLCSVLQHLKAQGIQTIYSHIAVSNIASLKLHLSCGFEMFSDYSVYIDGSVDSLCNTYVIYL